MGSELPSTDGNAEAVMMHNGKTIFSAGNSHRKKHNEGFSIPTLPYGGAIQRDGDFSKSIDPIMEKQYDGGQDLSFVKKRRSNNFRNRYPANSLTSYQQQIFHGKGMKLPNTGRLAQPVYMPNAVGRSFMTER